MKKQIAATFLSSLCVSSLCVMAIVGEAKARPGLDLETAQATPSSNPACESTAGTFKNSNGDLATVSLPAQGAASENQVDIYLQSQDYRRTLTFSYFVPNGAGTRSTETSRSVYFIEYEGWLVAVFGESSPLWYSQPRISAPDSLWFQVDCEVNLGVAKQRSLPTLRP